MDSKVLEDAERLPFVYSFSRSDVMLHHLQKSLKFTEWAGIHPFKWDFENRKMVHISTNSSKYFWCLLNSVTMLAYLAYVGARFWWRVHFEELDLGAFINNSLVLGYYGMLLLCQMLNWQNRDDLHSLTNAYYICFRSIERILFQAEIRSSVPVLKVAGFLGSAVSYLFPMYGMAALHGAIFPHSIDSLHAVIGPILDFFCFGNWFRTLVCYGLALIAHAWIGFNIGALLWVFSTVGVSQLFFLVAMLKQLRIQRHRFGGNIEVLTILKIYRMIQILLGGSQVAFDIALWLPVLCSMIVAIFGSYVLITVGGIMSFVAIVVGGGVLMFMLTTYVFFAEIFLEATRLKADLRTFNTGGAIYMRKVLRGLRTTRVTVCGLFKLNKIFVLVVLKVVVDSLANTLLLSNV